MQTSLGTHTLKDTAERCDARRGVTSAPSSAAPALEYSVAAHRTLIALRSAACHRPYHMVADKFYRAEVEMLRPGTPIPSPPTVAEDVRQLYRGLSADLGQYLRVSLLGFLSSWY
ncbi:hypothetical protein EV122DRAFT_227275 [Schizophyllum commune]